MSAVIARARRPARDAQLLVTMCGLLWAKKASRKLVTGVFELQIIRKFDVTGR